MKNLFKIIGFEVKDRLLTWNSLIFFLILIFQAIWFTKGSFDYYVNDQVLMNASVVIYRNYSGMGMLMVIIIAIVTGGVLYRDIQFKTANWMYTLPIKASNFFIGKFLSAFLYLVLISLGLSVGNLILPYVGLGAVNRFGDAPLSQIIHAVIIYLLPNIFLYVSCIFLAVVYTRKLAAGYLVCFVLVLMYLLAQIAYESSPDKSWLILLDPAGYVGVQHYFDHATTIQKNVGIIAIDGWVLANRIIWLSIGALCLIIGYFRFSFAYFLSKTTHKNKKKTTEPISMNEVKQVNIPKVEKSYAVADNINRLFRLSKLEYLGIVRPASFKIILGVICCIIILQNLVVNATYYIGSEIPLTSNMTYFRLIFGVFIMMLIMMWAGELFFKDRRTNIWQITDALSIPSWVSIIAKFVTITALTLTFCIVFVLVGIISQLILGYPELIDLGRYVEDLLSYHWGFINFILPVSLVLLIGGITGKRYLTHVLSIGIMLFIMISYEMGILEELRFAFANTPGVEDYSEMSGYGIFNISAFWFAFMWGVLGLAFILIGIWFWQRGSISSLLHRFKSKQLYTVSKVITCLLLLGFIAIQIYLDKNIYQNGNFTSTENEELLAANYETTYNHLIGKKNAKYDRLDLIVDLFPEDRRLNYKATIQLETPPIDTLFLNFNKHVHVNVITWNGKEKQIIYKDSIQQVLGILISNEVKSTNQLYLEGSKEYTGLSQGENQGDLTSNGSYASLREFLPTFGYDYKRELKENRQREDQGLRKIKTRMAPINDSLSRTQLVGSEDANLVEGSVLISTTGQQDVIAPGLLQKTYKQDQRTYYLYQINQPTYFNWHIGSANYKTFVSKQYKKLNYQIIADPAHNFNIELYSDAIEKAYEYLKSNVIDFDLSNISVIEKHHWSKTPFDAYANQITISEKQGWLADSSKINEQAYIYETIGAQMAKLWLQNHLQISNVQGAHMFTKALPEGIGLDFVENTLGEEALQSIVKKKLDKYAKDRNNEPNVEPSLLFADGIEYLEYNKGGVALYRLMQHMGRPQFYSTLHKQQDKKLIFKEFYTACLSKVKEEYMKEVQLQFETVD